MAARNRFASALARASLIGASSWRLLLQERRRRGPAVSVVRGLRAIPSKMGAGFSSQWQKWFGGKEIRVLMLGLDGSGKTSKSPLVGRLGAVDPKFVSPISDSL